MANPILTGGKVSNQSIYRDSTTQHHPVGTRGVLGEKVYYYSRNDGAAISPGKLLQSEDIPSTREDLAVAAAAAVGTKAVSVTLGALLATANDYQNGTLVVSDAAGEGTDYRISDHAAIDSAGTGTFNLIDPIEIALTTSSKVTLVKNPWRSVVIGTANQGFPMAVGVAKNTITIGSTTPSYFWCQTWGLAAVWVDDATIAIGTMLQGGTTSGQVEAEVATEAFQTVGINLSNGLGADDYAPVFLQIAP